MKKTITILTQYLKTKHFDPKTRTKLEVWQEDKIIKHLNKISKNSKYISDLISIYGVKNWREFPLMNKQVMMDNFDDLNTLGLTKEECFKVAFEAEESRNFSPTLKGATIGLSSGTSGNRGIFLVSEEEQNKWTATVLAKLMPSHLLSKQEERVAFFLRANSNLYESVNKGNITFEFFDLFIDFSTHLENIKKLVPTIIVAPPSIIRRLAEEVDKGALSLYPKKIISVAEVLDPIDEMYIHRVFKQKVHQVYQCTEGFLAATCSHGTIHLNEDIVHIEKKYIDEELGKFVPIITDFSRTAQPIIRYELNDILTEAKKPCPCGSPMLAISQIEGRCDDIFTFNSGNLEAKVYPDFIRRTIMKSSGDIEEYQVQQLSNERIVVRLKINGDKEAIEEKVKKEFEKLFSHYVIDSKVEIEFKYNFELVQGRKLKRVEKLF